MTLVEAGTNRWLVAPDGKVSWVRNARVAGQVTLSRRSHSETVAMVELGPEERVPVLKQYVTEVPITRPFFDAIPDVPRGKRLSPKPIATPSSASMVYQAKSSEFYTLPSCMPRTASRFRSRRLFIVPCRRSRTPIEESPAAAEYTHKAIPGAHLPYACTGDVHTAQGAHCIPKEE